ncbi:hypothetical protein So717_21000 [Roseobacter cerasinus]|uniref:Methyl-accepting chemotaxis protein n=1 Tax=Roseobacter cerasinus TaxID=2602289 RepID=A0A640VRC9_9RHOB|nr:methyl-accepting chemotaxis protein [Roseobacter cerasinus]GFE50347.1 hypothetical protein So717_21000 [Roseobacter cerasinus]
MSILMKISLGMGAIVALMIAVGGFASVQTSQLARTFLEYRGTAKNSLVAADVTKDLFEARLASLKYRATKDNTYIDEVTENISEIDAVRDQLDAYIASYPDMPNVAAISTQLRSYQQLLQTAYTQQSERNTLVAEVADLGKKARQQLTEIMETALAENDAEASSRAGLAASNLLLARLYLERFLVDNRPENYERSTAEIRAAQDGLHRLLDVLKNPRRRELASLTLRDLDRFDNLTNSVSETITARNAAYAEMDDIGPEAVQKMGTIVGGIVARQDMLGPAGQARAEQSIFVVVAILVVGTLSAAALSFFTARTISRGVTRVTDDMSELADGNLDIEIPRSVDRHEIGRMTNAMAVFLENAREARALDEQVKQNDEKERERARLEQQKEIERQREKEAARQREMDAERERMEVFENFRQRMDTVLGEAADGNFSVRLDSESQPDDLRALGAVINRLLGSMETNVSDLVESLAQLAKGDLGVRIEGDRKGSFERMQSDFNNALQQLSGTMALIMNSGQTVSGSSAELERTSLDMAKRAEDNAASVEETSAAVEQITASIKQVVTSAQAANEATQRARANAVEGRRVADETEASISALTDASSKISVVVQVIEDISFQINLLALNAGVEAARAGEAGRGFSVVASEVRSLAQRSQEAVQEISEVIEDNNRTVEAGVKQVAKSRSALSEIASEVEEASDQIADITSAVEEQSTGIQEVSTAVQTIDSMAQSNAASLEEMTAASVSLSQEARSLASELAKFKGIDVFDAGTVSKDRAEERMASHRAKRAVTGGAPVPAEIDAGWQMA